MQAFLFFCCCFFFHVSAPKRRSLFWQAFLAETVERRILNEKKLRWWGSVNFHCMQMGLVMSMRFIFGDDWNDAQRLILDRRLKWAWKTYSKEILLLQRQRVQMQVDLNSRELIACVAGGISEGMLYCFGGGASRRVGIQVNLGLSLAASPLTSQASELRNRCFKGDSLCWMYELIDSQLLSRIVRSRCTL